MAIQQGFKLSKARRLLILWTENCEQTKKLKLINIAYYNCRIEKQTAKHSIWINESLEEINPKWFIIMACCRSIEGKMKWKTIHRQQIFPICNELPTAVIHNHPQCQRNSKWLPVSSHNGKMFSLPKWLNCTGFITE